MKKIWWTGFVISLIVLTIGWIKKDEAYIIYAFIPLLIPLAILIVREVWRGNLSILPTDERVITPTQVRRRKR
jgi:uncharacterized membrane protein (GlpM family)